MTESVANQPAAGSDPIKSFQLAEQTIKAKSEKGYGLSIAKQIDGTIGTTNGGATYYGLRNARYLQNRNIASGQMDIQAMFQDRLDLNGKQNYVNLDWSCIKLGNRILSGLVGRWMSRGEKIVVTATDPLSLQDKKEEYEQIEFIIENREMLARLQEESGVQLIPQDIPDDQQGLHLWVTQIQKLPEEICFEMGCNDVLQANGLFDAVKEKLLHDSSEVGFVGTYTWMDDNGVIRVEPVKPENAVYSFSEYPDFRDTTYRGRIRSLKISELRRRYGVEFGGSLTEEELFRLADKGKDWQSEDKLSWNEQYISASLRPYDERNVDVLEFELKTVDSQPYTIITTKKNKATLIKKGRPQKPDDNERVVEDTRWNIYRGVYVRGTDTMLEWGLKKNMIRPQDPREVGNAEFSYSFYMYQSRAMRNVAVPEKIEAPLKAMILTRLKMEQVIMNMRPPGAAIDVTALQELDLGLGGTTSPAEAQKIYDQTGKLYYRSKDAEGNNLPVPITELANTGFLPQMQALIQQYQFQYSILKDELGEDPNLITQAAQPRVAVQNIDTAQQQGENATDYMYRAFLRVMEDTATKISCLLHNSVVYGATAYRALLKEEDVRGRMFSSKAQMLSDHIEMQRFEALMNQAMVSTPELVLHIDPFQLMRVARENVKLAEVLFRQGQKKMLQFQIQTAQQNQQQTIEGQIASARASEEEKRKTKDLESKAELLKTQTQGDSQAKNTILAGLLTMFQKQQETGSPMPMEMQLLSKTILENVAIPAMVQNDTMKQQILQDMANAMQQKQAEEQAAQQEQQNNLQVA